MTLREESTLKDQSGEKGTTTSREWIQTKGSNWPCKYSQSKAKFRSNKSQHIEEAIQQVIHAEMPSQEVREE